eukprot:5095579-Lingulodinium_polyedra.AAC.1
MQAALPALWRALQLQASTVLVPLAAPLLRRVAFWPRALARGRLDDFHADDLDSVIDPPCDLGLVLQPALSCLGGS